LGILVVAIAGYGVMRFADWFNSDYVGGEAEASAGENLDEVERLLEANETDKAEQLLRNVLARVDDLTISPRALMLEADIHNGAGNTDKALESLRAASQDYPASPSQPVAAMAYGRLLEAEGRVEEALAVYEDVRDHAPPELRAGALTGLGKQQEREGDLFAARDLYAQAESCAPFDSPDWQEAVDGLGRLNVDLIFSSKRTPASKVYTVQKGDALTNIGIKLNTTQGLLMRANGLTDPNKLHLGQNLKYTPKDFRITIERSSRRIFLLDEEGVFKIYSTGLGRDNHETALGRYRVGNKEKNPTWFKPGSEPIPPLDPRNELGTRWMPMVPEEEGLPKDLGIHGTIQPDSIGKYSSSGCPRMLKADVEELYDLVVRSTPVTVVENISPIDL
jgi:tetratricopeptide (TPR) repeat protein